MTGLEALAVCAVGGLGGVVGSLAAPSLTGLVRRARKATRRLNLSQGAQARRVYAEPIDIEAAEVADGVARDFAVHVGAVSQQVSAYADALADGDEVLRARLRLFEQSTRRPAPPAPDPGRGGESPFGWGSGWSQ